MRALHHHPLTGAGDDRALVGVTAQPRSAQDAAGEALGFNLPVAAGISW